MRSMVVRVSSTTSWRRPDGDGHDVQLEVGQEIGHLERVDHVGLARMADLSLVLEGREDVGPPEQFEIGVRAVGPDLLEQDPRSESWETVSKSCQ